VIRKSGCCTVNSEKIAACRDGSLMKSSISLVPYIRQQSVGSPLKGTYLLTYLLITYLFLVAESLLRGFQLVKKFPAFYGIRRFITAVTSACHLSLS